MERVVEANSIEKIIIDSTIYGNIDNPEVDIVEELITAMRDEDLKKSYLASYMNVKNKGYPLDVEELTKQMGLQIVYEDLPDSQSGRYEQGRIIVNKNHHMYRQRFTIAHEIGHCIMHGCNRDRDGKASYSKEETTEERQANMFAGFLLMPYRRIAEIIQKNKKYMDEGRYDIYARLQDEFVVSTSAVLARLRVLGIARENW